MNRGIKVAIVAFAMMVGFSAMAAEFEVEITNITRGQTFTPILVVAHDPDIALFKVGEPALPELAELAESGATGPLDALLNTLPQVGATAAGTGLLGPGETTTIVVDAGGKFNQISFAGMLIPTNDTFVAIDSVRIPQGNQRKEVYAIAYDAGSEANDQNCNNMPGPRCPGGEGASAPADSDEGYVYVGNGFHTLPQGDGGEILGPQVYDWRNPVARVKISRVRK